MKPYLRSERKNYTPMYHELFDLYQPVIGDKATMYYLFLARTRNTDRKSKDYGYSWYGRAEIVRKFSIGRTTIPYLDGILEAAGLVSIERRKCGRGLDKIFYLVHDVLPENEYEAKQPEILRNLLAFVKENKAAGTLLGKPLANGDLQTERILVQ